MIQAMYSGVSGLKAHKIDLDVIGNNIANINTTGFKAGRVTFREMLSQTLRGAGAPTTGVGGSNPMQVGLGVGVSAIDLLTNQGSLQATGRPTDMAIEGNGLFVLGDSSGFFYSRDGSFQVDSDSNLVAAASGMKVLGWMADPATGTVDTTAPVLPTSALKVPIGKLGIGKATSAMSFGGNLDARTETGGQISRTAQFYDSLGVSHPLNLVFEKTADAAKWTYSFYSADAADPDVPLATGTIVFNDKGQPDVEEATLSVTFAVPNGATSPQTLKVSFQSVVQRAGESSIEPSSGDGSPPGTLETFSIDRNGVIFGNFTNGSIQALGQLAIGTFSNPAGLNRAGSNLMTESPNSGLPRIGVAGVGSRGNISVGFLESSNVDMATEFANMIVAQRGFQANSRIITAADEILQELVQLKR